MREGQHFFAIENSSINGEEDRGAQRTGVEQTAMTKRFVNSDDAPTPKRQKNTETTKTTRKTSIRVPETERHEIRSFRDLHSLLDFDQDVGLVARQSKDPIHMKKRQVREQIQKLTMT